MITTLGSAYEGVSESKPINAKTKEIMEYMTGMRTKEQTLREFFGLVIRFEYDEDGEIKRTHDDAENEAMLSKCNVHYHPRLQELGVSEDDFYTFFPTLKYAQSKRKNTGDEWIIVQSSMEDSQTGLDGSAKTDTQTRTRRKNTKKTKENIDNQA